MNDVVQIALLGLLTLVASAIGTATGFGTSTVMIPVLTVFVPLHIALLFVGVIHLCGDVWKVLFFKKGFNWKLVVGFGSAGIAASFLGASLSLHAEGYPLKRILGAFLVFLGFFIGCPYAVLDSGAFWSRFTTIFNNVIMPEEVSLADRFLSIIHYIYSGMGPVFIFLFAVSLLFFFRTRLEIFMFSFFLLFFLFMLGWKLIGPHYIFPLYPFIFIVTAKGLENLSGKWPFSFKGQLEMADDPFHLSTVVEEDDDAHPPAA